MPPPDYPGGQIPSEPTPDVAAYAFIGDAGQEARHVVARALSLGLKPIYLAYYFRLPRRKTIGIIEVFGPCRVHQRD